MGPPGDLGVSGPEVFWLLLSVFGLLSGCCKLFYVAADHPDPRDLQRLLLPDFLERRLRSAGSRTPNA